MPKLLILLLLVFAGAFGAAAQASSVYTSLATKACRTIESNPDEGGSYRGLCPGVGGYRLELLEGDIRQTINVLAPDKKKYELDLWSRVSSGFSSLGERAEWRVRAGRPFALILRFNASENPEDSSRVTSYLVVVKLTKNAVCVTDVLKPSQRQNALARSRADAAAGRPCDEAK